MLALLAGLASAPGAAIAARDNVIGTAPNGCGIRGAGTARAARSNHFSAGPGVAIQPCMDAGDNVVA